MVRAGSPESDKPGIQWRQCRGVLFVPLWVFLIDRFGFQIAALSIAAVTVSAVSLLAVRYFNSSPASLGLAPDGDEAPAAVAKPPPRLSRLNYSDAEVPYAFRGVCAWPVRSDRPSFTFDRWLTPDVGVASAGLLVSLATYVLC